MAKMIKCKSCNKEIASNAKVCPNCGAKNKKPFYKSIWFWVIIVIIVIGVVGGNDSSSSRDDLNSDKPVENKTVEYTKIDVDTLEDDLTNNAAAAKDKYKDNYYEITGRLGTIDSDLKYISLLSATNEWDISGIHCTIKDSATKDVVKSLTKDQTIVVKGKITDVGEVLGYYLDIDEIVPQ